MSGSRHTAAEMLSGHMPPPTSAFDRHPRATFWTAYSIIWALLAAGIWYVLATSDPVDPDMQPVPSDQPLGVDTDRAPAAADRRTRKA